MQGFKYRNITASTLVKTGSGVIKGIVINSHSSGTVKVWDAVTATNPTLFNTMTLSVIASTGERYIDLMEANFNIGCFVTIAGTADITILYK